MNTEPKLQIPVSPKEELVIRPYREGDEQAILETFNLVFSARRSLESWRWKFKENPHLAPSLALTRVEWSVDQIKRAT